MQTSYQVIVYWNDRDLQALSLQSPAIYYTILEWEWRDSRCNSLSGVAASIDLWNSTQDLDGFIGGWCSEVCEPVALMAAAFNIPFVSFGCTGNDLSNKVTYPTFSRSTGSWAQLATMMDVLTERMTWTTRIGIVTGTAHIMQVRVDRSPGLG